MDVVSLGQMPSKGAIHLSSPLCDSPQIGSGVILQITGKTRKTEWGPAHSVRKPVEKNDE